MKIAFVFLTVFFQLSNIMAQEGWFWQNPLPQGNELCDIIAFDENTVIAVGAKATTISTSDGGETWRVSHDREIATVTLSSISFIDTTTGWAVGEDEIDFARFILKTTNGGRNWAIQHQDNNVLSTIFFINPNAGWVVGVGTILNTVDGGKTWETQQVPISTGFNDVVFVDDKSGWVAGLNGIILHTDDGGQNWNIQDTGVGSGIGWNALHFIDTQTGWAVSHIGTGIKTTNGGVDWIEHQIDPLSIWLSDVYFASADTGWATRATNKLFRTFDGGESWTGTDFPSGSQYYLKSISFSDNNHGWIAATDQVFRSTDGGVNWVSQIKGSRADLQSLFFVGESVGWAVGRGGLLLRTTDSGKTWTESKIHENAFFPLLDVFFINENIGWACDLRFLYRTEDGGRTWTQVVLDSRQLGALFFIDENNGWVGDWGKLFKTTNAGSDWAIIESGIEADDFTKSIHFVNDSIGWLVGGKTREETGFVLKTSDGGMTWSRQDIPVFLNSVHFINDKTGYVVGENGIILKSTDGGTSWLLQNGQTTFSLRSVLFVDPSTGWIVGQDNSLDHFGIILQTTDGGLSWRRPDNITVPDLKSIFFVNADVGWIAGLNGTLLKTNTGGLVTSVSRADEQPLSSPKTIALLQNYPNPFNPSTRIRYRISKSGPIKLMIYNVLGREVAELVNGHKTAGEHEVIWQAENLPTGVYFYRLETVDFVMTKKLVLIR